MGDRLLCYRRKLAPMEIVTLLGLSKAFLDACGVLALRARDADPAEAQASGQRRTRPSGWRVITRPTPPPGTVAPPPPFWPDNLRKDHDVVALWIILGLIVIVAIGFIVSYNRFVSQKHRSSDAWANIDTDSDVDDLIPNLVETVKGYATPRQ